MVESRKVRSVAHAVVLLTWIIGWMMTWTASRANLYFEPTKEALQAARHAVPLGIVGSCLLLGAAALRLAYRPWAQAVLFAVLPAWVLVTFLAGPHDLGAWVWTLLLLPASVGMLAWGLASERRGLPTDPRFSQP